jgi:hypothetical protein
VQDGWGFVVAGIMHGDSDGARDARFDGSFFDAGRVDWARIGETTGCCGHFGFLYIN